MDLSERELDACQSSTSEDPEVQSAQSDDMATDSEDDEAFEAPDTPPYTGLRLNVRKS
jgi:hypothetical protein